MFCSLMNWYKKAQLYEDVLADPEYDNPDSRDAGLYFSIGQNEETIGESYCWLWNEGKFYMQQGPTTHGKAFGIGLRDDPRSYRGWVDTEQKLISVIVPRKTGMENIKGNVPEALIKKLYYMFDTDYKIKVF